MIKVICCSLFLLAFALAFIVFLEYAQYIANKYEGKEEDKTEKKIPEMIRIAFCNIAMLVIVAMLTVYIYAQHIANKDEDDNEDDKEDKTE